MQTYEMTTRQALHLASSRDPLTYSALNLADSSESTNIVPVGMSDEEEYERYVQAQGDNFPLDTDGNYDEFDAAGIDHIYTDDAQQPH